jgi:N-acetylglucosaminyl-diphospho-decaprenol L-rhamnosyltransferase
MAAEPDRLTAVILEPDRLTAVILNWRTPDHTLRAVAALRSDGVPAERIVVVDNASGDDSVPRIRTEAAGCRILELAENVGFARANNAGVRSLPASAAYLVLNSDAFVHVPGSVARLMDTLRDPEVGIVVPRLLNPDLSLQPNVAPLSTPLPELVRASGLSRLVPNRLQPALGTHWDHSRSRRIQAAVGPVLLVRSAAWDQLGGFDERLYMYAEDLDLFRRAAALGWTARFVAEAEFVHLGGASAVQRWGEAQRAERVARAEAQTIVAHLGPLRARLTLALMALGVGMRALFSALTGRRAAARTYRAWLRGYSTGLRGRGGLDFPDRPHSRF